MDPLSSHPQRVQLYDEVHARPPEPLVAPTRLSFLALYSATPERDFECLRRLLEQFDVKPPEPQAKHFSADLKTFRLKWERHTEFTRYKFIIEEDDGDPFSNLAIDQVPDSWLADLPGEMLVAAHASLRSGGERPVDHEDASARWFNGNMLVGSQIAGGAGIALTDFRIHDDGFSRLFVQDFGMTDRQAGRLVQRLLEIDTYRMLALLALPVAQELVPLLSQSESELAQIASAMSQGNKEDEPVLLERLMRLEADIESRHAESHYRFAAAAAYYDLVRRRIVELRERRIDGLQTFDEFIERRMAPAMNTCVAVSRRQESVSERVARATQLLSTRVDIGRQAQNQALLESMNRRAALQLRLQATVEGLSVAAISYYIVGLVGYASKGLEAGGAGIDADMVVGASIPLVIILVALGVRKIRTAAHLRKGGA